MSEVIAICGKGGVGKTTLAALFTRLILEKQSMRTLVIDADPTGGLSLALSLPIKSTINDLRKEVVAAAKNKSGDSKSLAASVDYRLLESLTEHRNLAFLAVGRPEEEGCYCQVNAFLRRSIEYLAEQFDLTLIDAEAGIEQVNRRVISAVDRLLLVSDLSQKGLRVAETVHHVAAETGIFKSSGLIVNRVRNDEELAKAITNTSLPLLGSLPEDEIIYDYDSSGKSFLDLPECPSLQAARSILNL
jgi:CO dehydrogenase maturation factor